MIHRAPFGSMERFIAILLEHTGGNFPMWLMPEQVSILSLSEKYEKYAQKVLNLLENHDIRALVDNRNETIGKKIRESEMNKIPFMLIVGEQEELEGSVSVRQHGSGDLGSMKIEMFIDKIKESVRQEVKEFKEV
jgi:threonyl-tRNA synthetase